MLKFIYSIIYSIIFPGLAVLSILSFLTLFTGVFAGYWFNPFTLLYAQHYGGLESLVTVLYMGAYAICIVTNIVCFANGDMDELPFFEEIDSWWDNLEFPKFGCKRSNE